jgi:hypothetical protein
MKITVKQLKKLIREQVEEVGYGMQEAGRRPKQVAPKLAPAAKEALSDEDVFFDEYIVISPTRVLVPDMDRPMGDKFFVYEFDGAGWSETDHVID